MISVYLPAGMTIDVIERPVSPPVTADVMINAAQRLQMWDGAEATAIGWQVNKNTNAYDPTFVPQASAVMARLVNELGIDRLQLPVRSGWHNTTDFWPQFVSGAIGRATLEQNWYRSLSNGTPQFGEFDFNVTHMLQPFLAAIGSRPRVVSLIFTDFGASGKTLDFSTNPAAYAAFVKVYVNRLAALGVAVDCIDVTLEPENTTGWQNATRIGQALVALKAALPNVRLIAPSCTNAYNTVPFSQAIEQVPGALAALDTVGYHRYGSGDYASIAGWALARGKRTGMTEWFPASLDTLFDDLVVGNVSTWQRWAVAGSAGSLRSNPHSTYYFWDGAALQFASNATVSVAPLLQVLPFMHVGGQRIGVTVPATLSKAVAFENADGKQFVAVKRDSGSSVMTFSGLRPGAYGVRTCASITATPVEQANVLVLGNGTVSVTVSSGFTTVYAK